MCCIIFGEDRTTHAFDIIFFIEIWQNSKSGRIIFVHTLGSFFVATPYRLIMYCVIFGDDPTTDICTEYISIYQ